METNKRYRSKNIILLGMITIFFVIWIILAINPYDRSDWLLENILIFAAIIYLIATFKMFKFSLTSYAFILIFLILHAFGAHYSYTKTPVDEIMHKFINLGRNNYDRVVHFSFGLFIVYPIKEMIERILKDKKLWVNIFAVQAIVAFSGLYELLEMWVATVFAPDLGPLFLGTQGDVWDTQHDIELALYGSVLSIVIPVIYKWNVRKYKR